MREYSEQFSSEMWRLLVWCLRALSTGLFSEMPDLAKNVDPFLCFLDVYFCTILDKADPLHNEHLVTDLIGLIDQTHKHLD